MSNEARRGTGPSVYRTLSPLTGRDGGGYGGDDGGKSRRLSVPELRGSGGTWQTRRPQKPVGETPWGFESPLPHHQLLIRFIEANGAISQSHACGVPAGSGDAHAAPGRPARRRRGTTRGSPQTSRPVVVQGGIPPAPRQHRLPSRVC